MTPGGLLLGVVVAWAVGGAIGRTRRRRALLGRLGADRAWRRPRRAAARSAPFGVMTARHGATPPGGAGLAAVALVVLALVVGPVVVLGVGSVGLAVAAHRRQRRTAAAVDAAVVGLPDTVDLVLVAARSGLPVGPALGAVAARAPPPWDAACAAVARRTQRGERLDDALDALVTVAGEPAAPLRSVLRSAAEDGTALVPALDRLATDARDARRRRAEEAARRIPVRLLVPLVACSLPALALLSIVPILAGAVQALEL